MPDQGAGPRPSRVHVLATHVAVGAARSRLQQDLVHGSAPSPPSHPQEPLPAVRSGGLPPWAWHGRHFWVTIGIRSRRKSIDRLCSTGGATTTDGALQGLHHQVLRRQFGIFVAADAALVEMVVGPNPAAASQRQAVFIHQLQLDRHVRRHLDVERPVRCHRHLAQDSPRGERWENGPRSGRGESSAWRETPSSNRRVFTVPGGSHVLSLKSFVYTFRQ